MNGQMDKIMNSKLRVYPDGTKRWYNERGELHREENDLPAIEYADGKKAWYKNGQLHRDNDLPAVIYYWGDKYWYKNGFAYRFDNWIVWNK